jgi:hypothetical protein
MDFNPWGFERFHPHNGEQPISEAHDGHDVSTGNQPCGSPAQLSEVTRELSHSGIGRGENHAQTAPRTARVSATGPSEPSSIPHGRQVRYASYARASIFRMDAQPPGDIPVFEQHDPPLNAELRAGDVYAPDADTADPSTRRDRAAGAPIGGHPTPTPANPQGLTFALYPI